eukprot:gene42-9646_t
MWIQVRTMDGKKSTQIDKISKLTLIEDLKAKIAGEFGVSAERQRLFFSGKQLENGHTLFDYNVGLNALIQVMFRIEEVCSPKDKNKKSPKKKENNNIVCKEDLQVKVNEADDKNNGALASQFKVHDKVDAMDPTMGAWFEAVIVKVTQDDIDSKLCYHAQFEGYDENEVLKLKESEVRPRARMILKWDEITVGDKVMANYNSDEPKERGFWYDVVVTRKENKRQANILYGKILLGKNGDVSEECRIIFVDEIFKIEKSGDVNISNANDENIEKRKVKPDCSHCKDDPTKSCKECSCCVCGGKHQPERQIICDECEMAYHLDCLNPPLESIPDEDEWYCPECRNDPTEIVQVGDKLKSSKRKQKMASTSGNSQRDWGKGMACVGRTKICTLVPSNHFGPVPGVPVGSAWRFRVQASEAGVHRPHVSGIHGRETEGAYSIVLAGGYEDDLDKGEEFFYTGSGGRDLSGNKRTAEQSCDQKLTKMNRALAKNCNAKIDDKNGGEAENWKEGKPVRVLRSSKFRKHSKFAPEEGVRYDGIYKIVKYWPEKGKSGFVVWRYLLRRDDPTPPPWSEKGKKLIKDLGLTVQYPEGYLEAQEKKEAEKAKNSKTPAKENSNHKRKREKDATSETPQKKSKNVYSLPDEVLSSVEKDMLNKKTWNELTSGLVNYQAFLESVKDSFMCICCQEVVFAPVTTKCVHNTCKACLSRAFKAGLETCPVCRHDISKDLNINSELDAVLRMLFPGYEAGR